MFLEKIIENQNKKSSMYMAAKKITRRKQRAYVVSPKMQGLQVLAKHLNYLT
jgi:hypothetical protein